MNTKMLSEQGKFLDTANFWEHLGIFHAHTHARAHKPSTVTLS